MAVVSPDRSRAGKRMKRRHLLGLLVWAPVLIGALMSVYLDGASQAIGVALWILGLAAQVAFALSSRRDHLPLARA